MHTLMTLSCIQISKLLISADHHFKEPVNPKETEKQCFKCCQFSYTIVHVPLCCVEGGVLSLKSEGLFWGPQTSRPRAPAMCGAPSGQRFIQYQRPRVRLPGHTKYKATVWVDSRVDNQVNQIVFGGLLKPCFSGSLNIFRLIIKLMKYAT